MIRKWMNIVEGFAETVSPAELISFVKGAHHTPDDVDYGDLGNRIWKFKFYVLSNIKPSFVNADEWAVDHARVQMYAALGNHMPPIIYDADEHSIIDGVHRVNAAVERGMTVLPAYVGLPENIDPEWSKQEVEESVQVAANA